MGVILVVNLRDVIWKVDLRNVIEMAEQAGVT